MPIWRKILTLIMPGFKGILGLLILLILAYSTYSVEHRSDGTAAATFALIASAVLFISLIPARGDVGRVVQLVLNFAGAFSTFQAARFWFESEGGIETSAEASLVYGVLIVILLAILAQIAVPFISMANQGDND